AAVGLHDLDAGAGRHMQLVVVRAPPQRHDRRMLEEDHRVGSCPIPYVRGDRALELPRLAVRGPAKVENVASHASDSSRGQDRVVGTVPEGDCPFRTASGPGLWGQTPAGSDPGLSPSRRTVQRSTVTVSSMPFAVQLSSARRAWIASFDSA